MEYGALAGGAGLLGAMPLHVAETIAATGGAAYGTLARLLSMRDHRVAMVNLEIAFPEKSATERKAILRSTWLNWGRFAADSSQLLTITKEQLKEMVTMESPALFEELRQRIGRRGLLILTAHFGSFEMLHAAVSVHGAPVTIVHRPMANPLADEWIRRMRTRFGTNVLARGEAARDVVRELRAGRIVAIPFDQAARKNTRIFSPFFGLQTSTNPGLARLAQVTGAPVFPVVIIRNGDGPTHRVWIGPEIELQKSRDREQDIIENTRRFNKTLEEIIRRNPDHWIWMYRRWKQQPEGLLPPYMKEAPPLDVYRKAGAAIL